MSIQQSKDSRDKKDTLFRTEFGNVTYRFVRILALKQGRDASVRYFCHFNDGIGEVVIEANYHEIWVSAWHPHPTEDYFHSVMIHCPVPEWVNLHVKILLLLY